MKYKVLSNLTHDGMVYPKGSEIEMTADAARVLVADGVIQDPADAEDTTVKPMTSSKPKAETKKEKEARESAEKEKAEAEAAAVISKYRVLKEFELPEGTTHEVDAVIELTAGQVADLKKGTVELVKPDENSGDDL